MHQLSRNTAFSRVVLYQSQFSFFLQSLSLQKIPDCRARARSWTLGQSDSLLYGWKKVGVTGIHSCLKTEFTFFFAASLPGHLILFMIQLTSMIFCDVSFHRRAPVLIQSIETLFQETRRSSAPSQQAMCPRSLDIQSVHSIYLIFGAKTLIST